MTEHRPRPKLAEGEHWPEVDRQPWWGPTERGRAAMRRARERLAAAESWHPGSDDARMENRGGP